MTPASRWRRAQAGLEEAHRVGELGLRVDAQALLPRPLDRDAAPAALNRERHDVGQVVLVLLGPVRDGGRGSSGKPGRVHRHDAGVADARALELLVRVPLLDDRGEVAVGGHPQAGRSRRGSAASCRGTATAPPPPPPAPRRDGPGFRASSAACRRRGPAPCPRPGGRGRAAETAWPVPSCGSWIATLGARAAWRRRTSAATSSMPAARTTTVRARARGPRPRPGRGRSGCARRAGAAPSAGDFASACPLPAAEDDDR